MFKVELISVFVIYGVLVFNYSNALKATSLIFSKNPLINYNDTKTETNATETNVTKPILTGIPQIDYIYDPNLPRELNGYNLSQYPFYDGIPDPEGIDFKCDGLHDGFYASVPHKCQLYHHCLYGRRFDFLCANYTAFDQKNFICHFVSEVDCENSKKYWFRNDALYKAGGSSAETTTTIKSTTRKITTTKATTTTDASENGSNVEEEKMGRKHNKKKFPRRRRPEYYYNDYDADYYDDYVNSDDNKDGKRHFDEPKRYRSAKVPIRMRYRRPQLYRKPYYDYGNDDVDYSYMDTDGRRNVYRNKFNDPNASGHGNGNGVKNRRFRFRNQKKANFERDELSDNDYDSYDDYEDRNQKMERKNVNEKQEKLSGDLITPKVRNGSSFSSIFSKPRGIPKILQHKNHKTTTTNTQKPTTETIQTTSTTTATTINRLTADLAPVTQKESTSDPTTSTQTISTPTTTEHTTTTPRATTHTTTTRTTTTETATTRRRTTPTTTSTAATSAINTFESYPRDSEPKLSDDIINTDYYDDVPESPEIQKPAVEIPISVPVPVPVPVKNNVNTANTRSVSSFGSFVLPSRGGNPYSYRNLKPVGMKATAFDNEDLQIVFDMKKEPQSKHYDYDMIFNEASNLNSERNYYPKPTVNRGPAFIYQNSENQHRPINPNFFERRNDNFSIIYDHFPMKNRRLRRYRNEDFRNYR